MTWRLLTRLFADLLDAPADDAVETQLLKYVGTLMRQNFLVVHRAFHVILLKHGMHQEILDEWSRHAEEGGWD
jgi:hypothetical protein